jgi:hypothetical protein
VGSGDAAGIDEAAKRYSQNRQLAQELGRTNVLNKIDALMHSVSKAKGAASAAPAERSFEAKQRKSRAQFERRADAYNDDPTAAIQ